jgi:geranylgeranyl diphosphate synthase type I
MTTWTPASPGLHPADTGLLERMDTALAGYLDERVADTARVHESVTLACDTLREFVLTGGKRVRPTFAWWGWRGAGGDPDGSETDAVLRAVSALELVQANALLHDDVMDASNTRRGRPSVHVAFAARHRDHGWLGRPDRFGESAAILLGDLALVWADDMFHGAGLDEAAHRRALPVWADMRTDLIGGQYLDVWTQATGDRSANAALRVSRFKCAAYTVERPLQLGATLAGAPTELVRAYRRFGADVGVAFQLRDDQLGVFGDPTVTGKPAGDDIREGKRTLLMALAMDAADRQGNDSALGGITDALGDAELTADGVDRVRTILDELGASAEVERRIEQLTETAVAALASAPVAEPAATRLPELADAATRRQA